MVLDTRTGIVPFTATTRKSFVSAQDKNDMEFSETIRKSEIEAIGAALVEAAWQLGEFIAGQTLVQYC